MLPATPATSQPVQPPPRLTPIVHPVSDGQVKTGNFMAKMKEKQREAKDLRDQKERQRDQRSKSRKRDGSLDTSIHKQNHKK